MNRDDDNSNFILDSSFKRGRGSSLAVIGEREEVIRSADPSKLNKSRAIATAALV